MATEAKIKLTAEDGTGGAFRSVQRGFDSIKSSAAVMSSIFGALSGVALGGFLTAMTRAAIEGEQAQAKLVGALRATGSAAGVTSGQIEDLVEELARSTRFDDEAITEAAASLLRFRDIQRETFTEALRLVPDVAAALGSDLPSAASALGKALIAPGEGMRALKNAGVNLSEGQEKLAQDLASTGRLAEAQDVVLRAVRKSVGDLARETNTGLSRATSSLSKSWDDMLEALGRTPAFGGRAEHALDALTSILRQVEQEAKGTRTSLRELFAPELFKLAGLAGKPAVEPLSRDTGIRPIIGLSGKSVEEERALAAAADRDRERAAELAAERARKGREEGIAAAKALQAQERSALDAQRTQLANAQHLSEVEKVRQEIAAGRFAKFSAAAKEELLLGAARIDQLKELEQFDRATEHFLAEREREGERIADLRDKYIDLIDPLQKYRKELEDIDRLEALGREGGGLDPVQALEARFRVNERMDEELDRLAGKTEKTTDEMTQFAIQAARNMQDAFAEGFFSIMQGKFDDLGSNFKATIDKMVANVLAAQLAEKLFGDFGKTGEVGGLVKEGLDFFGGLFGGGRAAGGPVQAGRLYEINERGAPEVLSMGGRDYLMMGDQGGTVTPAAPGGSGMTVVNNFHVSGTTDRRSQSQIAAAAGAGVRRAMARNT